MDQEDFEEIRYKLIIDPTEDESSRRFMVEFGLLQPNEAKTLVGSDFPDDGDLQRVSLTNTLSTKWTIDRLDRSSVVLT